MANSGRDSQDEDRSLDEAADADVEEPRSRREVAPAGPPPPLEVDLAKSAERLMRLIEAEGAGNTAPAEAAAPVAEEAAEPPQQQQQQQQSKSPPSADGLSRFLKWLTDTRQLGRRANSLLAAVATLRAPQEHRDRLAELVRLNLLLESNSAIGFNADGTLRNIEESAPVWTAADEEAAAAAGVAAAAAAAASLANIRNRMARNFPVDDPTVSLQQQQLQLPLSVAGGGDLLDDAEVLMAKEEVMRESTRHGLLVFTVLAMVASVVATFLAPDAYQWHTEWLLLVTATSASLMVSIAIFVRVGRRLRPIEAYREMGRELQSHRILISTIRHNG